ncbi:hypothetical protein ACHAC9_13110 [Massilia sp. CMS3.1]|uniref:hypothetical protein n=1 Tax=Massilia sp. CMS3.1 TaxID=3373083 RepID=UPI003EE61757
MRITILMTFALLCVGTALAQDTSPSSGQRQEARPLADDIALDAYLDALAQISPAAREGADAYLEAFKRRCGRALGAIELRRAIAEGSGDPVLMAMMRAAAQRDTAMLQRLSGTVACKGGR